MAYTLPDIQGWMPDTTMHWLYTQASTMASVLEVGSWRGRSTHALLSGCKGPVFAVDHFHGSPNELQGAHKDALTKDIFADFWKNVGHFQNLVVLRMDSMTAWRYFRPRSIDMIFIDACHTRDAVLLDLIAWHPVCSKLLCGHDFSYHEVKRALADFGHPFREAKAENVWCIDVKP